VKEGVNLRERSGRKRSPSGLASKATNYITARGAKPLRVPNCGNFTRQMPTASASSDLSVIRKFNLCSLEICHAPLLERINSRTAFAAFTNGGAAAIIITQNTTASQAKCWGASFIK